MTESERLRLLEPPQGRVDAVLDTDAYNEVDDQFALAYLLRSTERINLCGICAAPFHNERVSGPQEGMERSEEEIYRLLALGDFGPARGLVRRGACRFLPDERTAVVSDAAELLVQLALAHTPQHPLYVLGIAAATNIASAILLEPRILDRMVVVWLGGNARHSPNPEEFNLMQDPVAARVLFDSGAALVQLPCADVAEHFTVSRPELERWLCGKNRLASYLAENVIREVESWPEKKGLPWTKTIWDVTAAAWPLNAQGRFMQDYLVHSPVLEADLRYGFDARRHLIRYVYRIERDELLGDLFRKLLSA